MLRGCLIFSSSPLFPASVPPFHRDRLAGDLTNWSAVPPRSYVRSAL